MGEHSDDQARVYETRAVEYDALIEAEDCDRQLQDHLLETLSLADAVIADVGAGTGRLARWLAPHARHVHLIERARPMLELASRRLAALGCSEKTTQHVADARSIPLANDSVDAALAGWVFGHFRYWMPDGWRDEVDAAIAQMRRIAKPGAPVVVIETLGTGHETPREHPALDEYFVHLEHNHGMTRRWFRTDYRFPDAATAASVLGEFFGPEMAARIQAQRWARVPECTAVFRCLS